jgi:hypothetical protein
VLEGEPELLHKKEQQRLERVLSNTLRTKAGGRDTSKIVMAEMAAIAETYRYVTPKQRSASATEGHTD